MPEQHDQPAQEPTESQESASSSEPPPPPDVPAEPTHFEYVERSRPEPDGVERR